MQWALGFLIFLYMLFVRWTCRVTFHGLDHLPDTIKGRSNVIIAFWHSRIAMAPFGLRFLPLPVSMLISNHRDGRIIGKAVRFFGIRPLFFAPGSENKGMVLRQLISLLKQGISVGITPDGPKGPAYRAKHGIFFASLWSQCPVIPLSFSTSRYRRAQSWDRFFIPLPFGRFDFVFSPMIAAPTHKKHKESFIQSVEDALNDATKRADQRVDIADL